MNTKPQYPRLDVQLSRGRLILGDHINLSKPNPKYPNKKPDYFIAVAFEKHIPGSTEAVNAVMAHTFNTYAGVAGSQAVMQQLGMGLAATAFAWNIVDGDTHPKWVQREGARGCWIWKCRTMYPINVFDGNNVLIDPKSIKLGDYVDLHISSSINGEVGNTAGIFNNPNGLRFVGEGTRIVPAGKAPGEMFGAPTGAVPSAAPQTVGYAMPGGYVPPQQPAAAPGVGFAGGITPPPAVQHQAPQQPQIEPAVQQAARLGAQYHPGWRIDEATRQYVPDQPVQQYAPPAAQQAYAHPTPPAAAGGYPAPGQGVPAGALPAPNAGYIGAGGYPVNASPISPQNPPGVAQHQQFVQGPPRV